MIIDHSHFPMCFFLKILSKNPGVNRSNRIANFGLSRYWYMYAICSYTPQNRIKLATVHGYILIFDASMCPMPMLIPHLSERKKWRINMSYNHKQRARIVPIYGYNNMLCGSFKIQAFE